MKPFDLEAAKAGEPIVCRDGTPAKFVAYVPDAYKSEQVVALVGESIELFYESGMYNEKTEDCRDLFMATKKRTVWVNFYKHNFAIFLILKRRPTRITAKLGLILIDSATVPTQWRLKNERRDTVFYFGCTYCFTCFHTGEVVMSIEAMKQTFDFLHDLWEMKQTIRSDRHKKVMWELDRAIGKAEKEQADFEDFVAKVQEAEKQACEIINREWVGLTDEEKQNILNANTHPDGQYGSYTTTLGIINDTEAKLKEKNAYGWQSVNNPSEWLDELRGGKDEGTNKNLCGND